MLSLSVEMTANGVLYDGNPFEYTTPIVFDVDNDPFVFDFLASEDFITATRGSDDSITISV